MHTFKLSFAILSLLVALTGCEKDSVMSTDVAANSGEELRIGALSCSEFGYADTIFHLREQGSDYIVSPVKALSGVWGSSPAGLHLNALTGDINVSKSETGLRYRVFYARLGTLDTCSQYVTISGIDYPSSFYVLSRNDTMLRPVYNSRADLKMPCSANAANCDFDGISPVTGQRVSAQGVAINRSTGIIDLKRTLKNGVLGANLVNGTARIFRLYYRIDDASQKALNHIDVKLIYFDRLTNVPKALINKIRTQNARLAAPAVTGKKAVGYATADTGGRPPDIVVTGVE